MEVEAYEWAIIAISATLVIGYSLYYNLAVAKRPIIVSGNKNLLGLIQANCPIVKEKFRPTWWCAEGRMQTILRALLQSFPPAKFEIEYVKTPDGGEIKLDWMQNDEHSTEPKETRTTVLFLPGLTGSSDENYMRHLVHETWEIGCRCVVFNQRGTWGKSVVTPKLFCIAKTEDIEFIVAFIKKRYPDAKLIAMGISAGGVLMCNYLAKMKEDAQVDSAFIVSPPFDFRVSTPVMESTLNYWLLNKAMTNYLTNLIGTSLTIFEKHLDIDGRAIMKSKSLREVDELFTKKMFGYGSAFDYYADAALHHKIKDIKRPVVILVAEDDPFSPECAFPYNEVQEPNSNVVMVVTSHGGHIGFMEGTFPRHRGYMYRWFRQYAEAILKDDSGY